MEAQSPEYMMTKSNPQLKIARLEVTGAKGCQIDFDDKINIIQGENSLGKTTVLKLIHYGLGSGSSFIKEIASCDNLNLEIELNDQTFLLRRNLKKPTSKVRVFPVQQGKVNYEHYFEYALGSEFSNFILHHLQIPAKQIPQGGRQFGETKSVTFLELFGLMYVSQDAGYVKIQANQRHDRMKKAVVETLIPLSGLEVLDLEVEHSRLNADRLAIKTEIDNNNKLLKELEIPPKGLILARINEIEAERNRKSQVLLELKQQMRGSSEVNLQLRQEILDLDQALQDLVDEITMVRQKVNDFKLSRNEAKNEQSRLRRYSELQNVLSSFIFSNCPRCSQPITMEMRHREDDDRCMLCNRELLVEEKSPINVTKHIRDLEDEIRELDQLIDHYELSIVEINSRIEKRRFLKRAKEQELDEKMGEHFTSPFISNLESISGEIAALSERIHLERAFLSVWEKLDERYEHLADLDEKLSNISGEISAIRQKKAEDQKKLDILSSYLHEFLFDIYRDYETSTINLDTYEPLVNHHSYKNVSSVQRDLTILGYHYSLLRYSLHEESYYPRFLMVDTPNKDDMDPEIYQKVMHKFSQLTKEKTNFQLILATRDVPDELRDNVQLELNSYLLQDIQLPLFGRGSIS